MPRRLSSRGADELSSSARISLARVRMARISSGVQSSRSSKWRRGGALTSGAAANFSTIRPGRAVTVVIARSFLFRLLFRPLWLATQQHAIKAVNLGEAYRYALV